MTDVSIIFGIVGATILIGFLGNRLFRKTGVPELVPILVLGLFLGPVFHLVEARPLIELAPVFGAVALVIILFNAGLNLDLYRVLAAVPRATLLALCGFIISVLIVTGFSIFFFGLTLSRALLLGCILGGSSAIIVLPIVQTLNLSDKVETVLSLESTLTDIFVVVTALSLIELILRGGAVEVVSTLQVIASRFSVGIVLGLVLGIAWLLMFPKVRRDPYRYTVTLFMAFLVYAATEVLGGNGALSTLIFGIVLGNGATISKILKVKREVTLDSDIIIFQSEISFLIRSFFFVYIGIIATISTPSLIVFGVVISILLLNTRAVAVFFSSLRSPLREHRLLMTAMLPRGLAAAALASLPIGLGITGTEIFPDIAFVVILSTTLISVVGTVIVKKLGRLRMEPLNYLEEHKVEEYLKP